MKIKHYTEIVIRHQGENRRNIRLKKRIKKNTRNYFVLPNELLEKYRERGISEIDVRVFSYISSLRINRDYVRVSQKTIAVKCGITPKTVRTSTDRLLNRGLILQVNTEIKKHCVKKYETSIYILPTLPETGYFCVPRRVFRYDLTPKMFAVYLFMCRSRSFEYGKSWNSYNDIARHLGFGKGQRSEVMSLISGLTVLGLIKKTVRKMKKSSRSAALFVDNIYRVVDFAKDVLNNPQKNETPPL